MMRSRSSTPSKSTPNPCPARPRARRGAGGALQRERSSDRSRLSYGAPDTGGNGPRLPRAGVSRVGPVCGTGRPVERRRREAAAGRAAYPGGPALGGGPSPFRRKRQGAESRAASFPTWNCGVRPQEEECMRTAQGRRAERKTFFFPVPEGRKGALYFCGRD